MADFVLSKIAAWWPYLASDWKEIWHRCIHVHTKFEHSRPNSNKMCNFVMSWNFQGHRGQSSRTNKKLHDISCTLTRGVNHKKLVKFRPLLNMLKVILSQFLCSGFWPFGG
jgi:hypothetical protein